MKKIYLKPEKLGVKKLTSVVFLFSLLILLIALIFFFFIRQSSVSKQIFKAGPNEVNKEQPAKIEDIKAAFLEKYPNWGSLGFVVSIEENSFEHAIGQ